MRVSWGAVPGATHYKVYHDDFFASGCRVNRSGRPSFCDELASSVSGTTYLHTAPDDDRNYYWVVACNTGGCSPIASGNPTQPGPPSPVATATPLPTPAPQATVAPALSPTAAAGAPAAPTPAPLAVPGNVRATWEGTAVRVSWSAVPGATHYKVYHDDFFASGCRVNRSGRPSFCDELASSVSGTTYLHTAPDDDRNYYWVVACHAGGCSEIDRSNPAEPGASSQVTTATTVPATTATQLPTSTATSTVGRTPTATPVVQDTPTSVPTTTRVLTPQRIPTATPSPSAVRRTGAPAPPTSVRAVYVDRGYTAKVSWSRAERATYYQIFINSRSTCSDPGDYWCSEVASRVTGTSYLDTATFITLGGDVTHYHVRACNSDGCSSLVGAPTLMATPTPAPSATPTQTPRPSPTPIPLPQPSNVRAAIIKNSEDISWTEVLISWDPAVESTLDDPDPVRYSVYFSYNNNCDFPNPSRNSGCYFITFARGTSTVFTPSLEPKPDTTHYFWVIACDWEGRRPCSNADSPAAVNYSNPAHFIAPTPSPTPWPSPKRLAAPSDVRAVFTRSGSAEISWTSVAGADYYKVYRSDSPRLTNRMLLVGIVQASGAGRMSYVHPAPRRDSNYYWVLVCGDAQEGYYGCGYGRPAWVGTSVPPTQGPTNISPSGFVRPVPPPGPQPTPYGLITREEAWRRWRNLHEAANEDVSRWGPHANFGITRPAPGKDPNGWWRTIPNEAYACATYGICN